MPPADGKKIKAVPFWGRLRIKIINNNIEMEGRRNPKQNSKLRDKTHF